MRVERDADGRCRVKLSGRLTFTHHHAFDSVPDILAKSGKKGVVFDLSRVEFMDSAGLWMLLMAMDEAWQAEVPFELVGAQGEVLQLLQLAGIKGFAGAVPAGMGLPVQVVPASPRIIVDGRARIVCGAASVDAVRGALIPPYAGFVEQGADGMDQAVRTCLESLRQGGFSLSLTTTSAWGLDITGLANEAIRRLLPEAGEAKAGLIELCLAEAVSNAVIHGNLAIEGGLRATRQGFDDYRSAVRERLADPRFGSRRVTITVLPHQTGILEVAVGDCGAGFDVTRFPQGPVENDAKCGRGLALIRRIADTIESRDGGRTLVMAFAARRNQKGHGA